MSRDELENVYVPEPPTAGGKAGGRVTSFATLVSLVRSASPGGGPEGPEERRRLLADLCKLLGERATGRQMLTRPAPAPPAPRVSALPRLPPRTREVLELLLKGRSEKEVARELGLSVHTVHVHVKQLYRKLEVTSRGELLARCLGR